MHWKAIVLVVAVATLPCLAGELWVDAAARSSGSGSKRQPFRTITEALKKARTGDTISIKGGVYREELRIPERGAGVPALIRGVSGERVILSGTKPVTGWKKHKGEIYTARIDWQPKRLLLRAKELKLSRHPNEGWFKSQAVTETTLTAPELQGMTVKPSFDSTAYVWTQFGNNFHTTPIVSLDRTTGIVKVKKLSKWMQLKVGDKFYFENSPNFIDRPGEWAVSPADGGYDVYYYPAKKSDLDEVEAPAIKRRLALVHNAKNIRIENLEFYGGVGDGIYVGRSESVTVARCSAYQNGGTGINTRDCSNLTLSRNVSWYNKDGISVSYTKRAVIEQNDIAWNKVDALLVTWKSDDIQVQSNCIHHQLLWGHPDGIQLYRGVTNVRFVENLVFGCGQTVMMEDTSNGEFRGNLFVGSMAYMLIFGHGNADDYKVHNNTFAYAGYGCMNLTGKKYDVTDNIFFVGHPGPAFGTKSTTAYTGDRNVFWNAQGLNAYTVVSTAKGWHRSMSAYQGTTGNDAKSVYADPLFRNAPAAVSVLTDVAACTRDRWFLRGGAKAFKVGDLAEVNFDGIARRVTAVDGKSITVDRPLRERPVKSWIVANWKTSRNFELDFRLKTESPARVLGEGGRAVGSRVDFQAYVRGDFDSDGRRDRAAIPRELR